MAHRKILLHGTICNLGNRTGICQRLYLLKFHANT